MLIVSTNISATLRMSEQQNIVEDLEDGEIESDGEECKEETHAVKSDQPFTEDTGKSEEQASRPGKKKKSKNNKGAKNKKKNKKKSAETLEEIASNIENALKNTINMEDEANKERNEYGDERKKRRKRKNSDGRDGSNKKRKKQDYSDDVDESEMMCVRGASPVRKPPISENENSDSYESDSSHASRGYQPQSRPQRRRHQRDRKGNKNNNDRDRRRGGAHPNQDPDGICLYYMQGKCHKGDDCMFSHDALPPRKMELCKFYLMECCAKRDKCLYMHADFPCKYYHTGLPCIYKDECKFAHGQPLTENLKNILLKHIESAPKEILGDFPRLNRDGALKMINTTQLKLMQQFPNADFHDTHDKNIPSLFDLNLGNPQNNYDISQVNQINNDKHNIKQKMRQSRWQNDDMPNYNHNVSALNTFDSTNVLNIKNLTGVLTPRQISDLSKMGIENLDQLGQLTVLQLNSIGISLKQITEIQLNTMSIQKLGLINSNDQPPLSHQTSVIHAPLTSCSMDLDLRVHPVVTVSKNSVTTTILPGQDVDMRFHNSAEDCGIKTESKTTKDTIDIDQYTKDALKFASKEKDHIEVDQSIETEKPDKNTVTESKDVDHRVLPFTKNTTSIVSSDATISNDTDIRFLQPEPVLRPSPTKRNRRSTTDDDEESNLLIDEKWYSSDDEKNAKRKSPTKSPGKSPQLMSPPYTPAPHVIEPSSVLSRLGDLSKIDISEEVTKLLNTMKNNMQDTPKQEDEKPAKPRDPRGRRSPQPLSSPKQDSNISKENPKKPKVSIYECVDGEPTDGRRRSDIDLRETQTIADTDLRHSSCGDIDLRLGLPFKPLPNYTPASEIDGSINSHPPMNYKLVRIDIPRPDYTDIRNSTAKSQALVDPRLRKVFRLSMDESNSDSEKSVKSPAAAAAPRLDPRRKQKEAENSTSEQKSSLDLQVVIQNSEWYKDLSSTQKIFVNQQIAIVTSMIKQFHSDKTPGKKFDLSAIQNNSVFSSIFTNLNITLSESGEFSYLPKPKEALLKTPPFNPNSNPYSNMPGHGAMENPMLNMPPMGMGGVGPMGMGSMGGYNNAPYADPRNATAPGLLGMAPNLPPNFNYGNMPYNGPGPDFGNMDVENYQRFAHNRGGHRGRGNERWNRGGPRGGHRDRNRGNWKGHQ